MKNWRTPRIKLGTTALKRAQRKYEILMMNSFLINWVIDLVITLTNPSRLSRKSVIIGLVLILPGSVVVLYSFIVLQKIRRGTYTRPMLFKDLTQEERNLWARERVKLIRALLSMILVPLICVAVYFDYFSPKEWADNHKHGIDLLFLGMEVIGIPQLLLVFMILGKLPEKYDKLVKFLIVKKLGEKSPKKEMNLKLFRSADFLFHLGLTLIGMMLLVSATFMMTESWLMRANIIIAVVYYLWSRLRQILSLDTAEQ